MFCHPTRAHLQEWLQSQQLPQWVMQSIAELIMGKEWEELNNRFLKPITFGTGGMRGRTIAYQPTQAERGGRTLMEQPEHAAVGVAMINDFNIIQATIGLFNYAKKFLQDQRIATPPKIVIAYDVRYFSKHFGELTAATWTKLGGIACLFKEPRSTPQLSFSIRHLKATAGVVITASHNPSHDNGYKVYFSDGGQIVSPHAEGIIEEVRKVKFADTLPFLNPDLSTVELLKEDADKAYQKAVEDLILEDDVIKQSGLKVVYTPIHGTGQAATLPILKRLGVDVHTVAEQMEMNGAFPTVQSPNPENTEALSKGIQKAEQIAADLVLATDPDADRMGVAVHIERNEYALLNGNTIGALMADFYISQLKRMGFLPEKLNGNAALVTTFVTTPLLETIAEYYGLKVIYTLTGFKYIGEKIDLYQKILEKKIFCRI
jgi:phosphoglucomutase